MNTNIRRRKKRDGYYAPSDIRNDGLLKMPKLRERDAIAARALRPYSQSTAFEQANPDGE